MKSTPNLGSLAQRRRAFERGELELVLNEYALLRQKARVRLRKLDQTTPGPRGGPIATGRWLRLAALALRQPAWAAQARQARRPAARSQVAAPRSNLPRAHYPAYLIDVGPDRFGRPCRLQPAAAKAWRRMQAAAASDGIELELVSGFRSVSYQQGIWRRKLARGLRPLEIARVSAVPGYSEHHSGRALDLASGAGPVLEQSFAQTPAYRWLQRHAARFGFAESYPPDNRYGIIAEPWHWCWQRRLPG